VTSLQFLTVCCNEIATDIDSFLASLPSSLITVDARDNQIHGVWSVGSSSHLYKITKLYLPDNKIEGKLPIDALSFSTELRSFNAANNKLSGQIPSAHLAPNLHSVRLNGNSRMEASSLPPFLSLDYGQKMYSADR
jgi:hypothetical protein